MKYTLFPSLSRTLQLRFVRLRWAAEPTASLAGAAATCRRERQGSRIDAVSFAGRTGSVIENVPEVSTALRAAGFHPVHPIGEVVCERDDLRTDHIMERRPT